MNWQELYESEKKKRTAAEARVAELEGTIRASREVERIVDAAIAAGVPPRAAKACATAIRREAEVTFGEAGRFEMAELAGRVHLDPIELVHTFLRTPEGAGFTAEHIAAVEGRGEARNAERVARVGEGASGAPAEETFTGPESWKNMDPAEMADMAWKTPPPKEPAGPDPFASFLEDRS